MVGKRDNEEPACLLFSHKSYLIIKTNLGSFLFMIKPVSQALGDAPCNVNYKWPCAACFRYWQSCLCFKKLISILLPSLCIKALLWLPCWDHLLLCPPCNLVFFSGTVMANLLCLLSAPVALPFLPANSPFGNPIPLSYKSLVFLTSRAAL